MFNVSVAVGLVWVLGITQPYTNVTQISLTSGQGANMDHTKVSQVSTLTILSYTELSKI